METKDLPLKQELFCKYYIQEKGNATKAYKLAYGTKNTDTAKSNAHRMLTNAYISKRIREIMGEEGLNDILVDIELKRIIFQNDNLPAKMRGISEYNKLAGRYDEPIHKVNVHVDYDLTGKTLKELEIIRQTLL